MSAMGDEPRRSGRATKGINNKNQELVEAEEGKRFKNKAKGLKTAATTESPAPDDNEEDAIIRCVCGIQEDDGGRVMICCDNCTAWQHNDCMDITEEEDKLPDQYFCEQCAPKDHEELLAAIKRGVKPWEEAARQREEAKRKKRKGGRKSKSARQSRADEAVKQDEIEPTAAADDNGGNGKKSSPVPAETNKRKFDSDGISQNVDQPTNSKRPKESPTEEPKQSSSRRKSNSAKEARQQSVTATSRDVTSIAHSIAELQNENRTKITTALGSKIEKQVRELSKSKMFRIPDGHTPGSLAQEMALAVEHALYMNHCHETQDFSGQYKTQFTSIMFNIGQNSSLLLRLLTQQLSADELSRMQSDDMASEELQQKMASMKEEVDKQSILIQDAAQGPRVRRTHKGEELVEDLSNQTTNESIMAAPALPRPEIPNLENSPSGRSPSVVEAEQATASDAVHAVNRKPAQIDTKRATSVGGQVRRSSSNFDINTVWSSVQSPDQEQSRTKQPALNQSFAGSNSQGVAKTHDHDEEIDRLLNEDANDSPPYSPVEYGGDANITWRGLVDMPSATDHSVARFKAVSYHVAGSNLVERASSYAAIFPTNIVLHGRIDIKRADTYLTSLSSARSTDVTVHNLVIAANDDNAAKDQFNKLFNYFHTRQRYGVVGEKLHRDHVRDIYLVPLEAGLAELPQFLQRLDVNNIEQPRPQRMLLIVFVLKWEDGVSSAQGTPTTSTVMSPHPAPAKVNTAMSTVTAGQQHLPHQQNANVATYTGLLPGYPYAPSHSSATQHGGLPSPTNAAIANEILGQLFHCPTAQTIITSQPNIPIDSLRNLRQILEAYPNARDDMSVFTFHLAEQHTAAQS